MDNKQRYRKVPAVLASPHPPTTSKTNYLSIYDASTGKKSKNPPVIDAVRPGSKRRSHKVALIRAVTRHQHVQMGCATRPSLPRKDF